MQTDTRIIAQLTQKLNTQIEMNATLNERNIHLSTQLEAALKTNQWLKEQVKLGQSRQFGRSSEARLQLPLFDANADETDVVDATIVQNTSDANEEDSVEITNIRRKKSVGRQLNTEQLPREQHYHDISDADKTCACGCQRHIIGEDCTEELIHIPATLKVIAHITPKYACRRCNSITASKRPMPPLPKSPASSSLIADVVLKKYDQHLPLYRQSKILAQEGIDIPDNTLGNWVMNSAAALSPLAEAFWQQLNTVTWLQADETTVKILKPDKKGYLWGYHSLDDDNRFVLFEFALGRGGDVAQARLTHFAGFLQTDGYAGYHRLGERDNITLLGCWDHARRKFTDAIKVNADHKNGKAGQLLRLINRLYKIERMQKKMDNQTRYEARQAQAIPLLDDIFLLAKTVNAPPKGLLARAVTYLLNQEEKLRVYVEHGNAQISNCLMENHIRPLALGRKNWLFVGNQVSANRSALWYSLIQTCKMNHIHPRRYLITVLNHVHQMRKGEIDPKMLLPQFIDPTMLVD